MNNLDKDVLEVGRKLEDWESYLMRKKLTIELYGDYQDLLTKRLGYTTKIHQVLLVYNK